MVTPPTNLVYANTMFRACENCKNDVPSSHKKSCKHVICLRCDLRFREQYPDHQCGLCRKGRRGSDDEKYAKPVPQPREVKRRPSMVRELCESCGDREATDTYCRDCQMYICADCVRQHSTMAVLKRHVMESRAPLHPQPQDTPAPSTPSLCEPTLEELSKKVSSRLSAVNQRNETLQKDIDRANRDLQAHTEMTLQDIKKHAEEMKREIDEQVERQTLHITSEQRGLLIRFKKRKEFIALQAERITTDLSRVKEEAETCLRRINRQSLDTDGYTKMSESFELTKKRSSIAKKLEETDELLREMNFEVQNNKLKLWTKIVNVAETRVQRFLSEDSYVATAMTSAPVECILFTSCKGEDKAAADLVNINGNPLHTRKLQDRGQNPSMTPAYAALIEAGVVVIGWETSIFSMKITTRDEVENSSVGAFLVPGANVCCLTVDHDRRRVIFGNNMNRIINTVSYEMQHMATTTLKEECGPPTSLACWGENLLVADGVDAAFAADPRGNTVARFLPPQLGDLKPVAVATCGNTAYVLWVTRSEQSLRPGAYVQSYNLDGDSVGEHVSNAIRVSDNAKFIAVISTMNDDDRLIVGTPKGNISIYCVQEV